jgi:hypothetical protein
MPQKGRVTLTAPLSSELGGPDLEFLPEPHARRDKPSNDNAFDKVTMASDAAIVQQDRGRGSVFIDGHTFPNSLIESLCNRRAPLPTKQQAVMQPTPSIPLLPRDSGKIPSNLEDADHHHAVCRITIDLDVPSRIKETPCHGAPAATPHRGHRGDSPRRPCACGDKKTPLPPTTTKLCPVAPSSGGRRRRERWGRGWWRLGFLPLPCRARGGRQV